MVTESKSSVARISATASRIRRSVSPALFSAPIPPGADCRGGIGTLYPRWGADNRLTWIRCTHTVLDTPYPRLAWVEEGSPTRASTEIRPIAVTHADEADHVEHVGPRPSGRDWQRAALPAG